MDRSFEDLVEKYHRLVTSLIYRYYGGRLKDRAEDLSQDIWTKLWENFKKNENNVVNFKSYLYRTVQTTMWDAIRSLERDEQAVSLESQGDPGGPPEAEVLQARLQLDRLLAQLPEEHARMVRAHLRGFNNAEIAALLGCSEGRVRNLLTRIKKTLADLGGR